MYAACKDCLDEDDEATIDERAHIAHIDQLENFIRIGQSVQALRHFVRKKDQTTP